MKPLLIYLKPKDGIHVVDEAIKDIPCEKLILKYFPYPMVYQVALKYIKANEQYSHIIWVQNDIVFNKAAFEKLVSQMKLLKLEILGCAMNVDTSEPGKKKLAYTMKPFVISASSPPPYVNKGDYHGIIRCFHNGSVFICTRKHFLKYPLVGQGKTGYNADYELGQKLWIDGVSNWIDTDIELLHLRYEGTMQVGHKAVEVEFVQRH